MGWALIVLGIGLVIGSFTVTTTVHSDATYLAGLGYQEAKDTYNLGLLQQQMMLLQSGLAVFVAGVIAVSVAQLRYAMRAAGTAHFIGIWETEAPKPVSAVPTRQIEQEPVTE